MLCIKNRRLLKSLVFSRILCNGGCVFYYWEPADVHKLAVFSKQIHKIALTHQLLTGLTSPTLLILTALPLHASTVLHQHNHPLTNVTYLQSIGPLYIWKSPPLGFHPETQGHSNMRFYSTL